MGILHGKSWTSLDLHRSFWHLSRLTNFRGKTKNMKQLCSVPGTQSPRGMSFNYSFFFLPNIYLQLRKPMTSGNPHELVISDLQLLANHNPKRALGSNFDF
jgi:hypothetical protein